MGSMVIFHYTNNLTEEEILNVMLPNRIADDVRGDHFRQMMLDGKYVPAYVIESDDLDIAFDVGNGYPPADVSFQKLVNGGCHTSTSVGDIIIINGVKRMLVMPMGFEEI